MGKTFKDKPLEDEMSSFGLARRLEKAKLDQSDFRCCNCGSLIPGTAIGSKHRNHCPFCLFSKHVDSKVGNRSGSNCNGKMKPDAIRISPGGGDIQILHICTKCNKHSWNRISGDDILDKLLELAKSDEELVTSISEGYLGKTH